MKREHPEWMYSMPGPWAVRVRELEAALLESNDTAAALARELRRLQFWTGAIASALAVTLNAGGKLFLLRGHVLFEQPVTEIELRAIEGRRTFRLLMGHGAALRLAGHLLDFALRARQQRALIEATNGNLKRNAEEDAFLAGEAS